MWPTWAVWWYTMMCLIAAFNVLVYVWALFIQKPAVDEQTRRYERWMRGLACPMVLVCAWRCVFPSTYLERFTWYDAWPCSIFLERNLAAVAEIAWVMQIALAVAFIDRCLPGGGHLPTQVAAKLMVVCICCAEVSSDYATITKNGFGYFLEETFWGVTFTLLVPASVNLVFRLWQLPKISTRSGCCNAVFFAGTASIVGFGYIVWQWTFHVPQQWRIWRQQLADGDVFYGFWPGVRNASLEHVVTHEYADWGPSLVWLTGYFSAGVWSSIALTFAPRVKLELFHSEHDAQDGILS
eukprot:TRINITY_DN77123_c0_g1_i1.p1 TRINITY_DN77123_c0_g1~~TRINITY_DN77123_c0_g1_i1.p1  ORF type:complete len:296 (-),score=28.52 TRINITY_DN77123_c0_g1_i1:319-1206(-)